MFTRTEGVLTPQATCLVIINLVAMFAACQGVMTVASRIVYSFGRDRGFGQLSPFLERVHPTLLVPHWSIIFSASWVVIFGLICKFQLFVASAMS